MNRIKRLCFLTAVLLLCACAGQATSAGMAAPATAGQTSSESAIDAMPPADTELDDGIVPMTAPADGSGGYQVPPFANASFHADAAEGKDAIQIDLSETHLGYVAVSAKADNRLKFQVICEAITYTYDLKNDGTPSVFPLQSGSTTYTFRVMENVEGKKYAARYSTKKDVVLDSEFAPFLRPSDYSNYTESSACVQEAARFAKKAKSALDVVADVYKFVNTTVRYDMIKAATVQSGYMPDPDETLKTGKGICFDYASLAAAMLRSQGIPCKLIFGYVAPNDLYHAWNMFYTEESGWVTVSFQVHAKNWTRLDLTFTANGENDAFIGDGTNYADLYYY